MSQFGIPQTINNDRPSGIFALEGEDEKIAYMRSLGAKNIDPPLERSSHLRNKINGRIIPWNELLAVQRDIMECCDASGNTDPEAWKPTVTEAPDENEERITMLMAQSKILEHSAELTGTHRATDAVNVQPAPMNMPYGAVPYGEINVSAMNNLIEQLG